MAEETNAGAAAAGGAGAGGGAASTGVGGSGMSAADIAAPGGDVAFLEKPSPSETAAADTKTADATKTADTTKAAEETKQDEINLAALEEGQPEWLAKVTDPDVKTEVQKLLDYQKTFSEKFEDAADLDAFFKDLPGGREQVAALQTLSKEVGEIDSHIEANTPEGNGVVAERYLSQAPDGGIGLFRAGAQHLAKTNPEGWGAISNELITSTLKAAGVGLDAAGLVSAISEMRAAVEAEDGEAFGKASGKLLGTPKAEAKPDASVTRLQERETAARNEAQKAQTESWQFRNEKSSGKIDTHIATEAGKLLAKVLPASIAEKDRTGLREEITREVYSQLTSNAFLRSQAIQLIGHSQPDGKGGFDYGKANLKASQADWDTATKLVTEHATPKLIAAAVNKVVSQWSRDRAASNKESRDKARSAATKTDVGAGKTAGTGNGRKPLTAEQVRSMSDEEFLKY